MNQQKVVRGIYAHFKKDEEGRQKLYFVEGVAIRSGKEDEQDEQQQDLNVEYRHLYGDDTRRKWRPLGEFVQVIERPEYGHNGPRYTLVEKIGEETSYWAVRRRLEAEQKGA